MLHFAGDTHGSLSHLAGITDPIIHVGDFELRESLSSALPHGLELWWIPGNHDHDNSTYRDFLYKDPLAAHNLNARIQVIDGQRVAGLGGIFSGRIWRPPDIPKAEKTLALRLASKSKQGPEVLERHIWREDFDRLASLRADILVTHEAPSSHRHGFAVLDELAEAMGVHTLVHGHHHTHYDATICGGRVRVIGLGLREVRDLSGAVIRPAVQSNRRAKTTMTAPKSSSTVPPENAA